MLLMLCLRRNRKTVPYHIDWEQPFLYMNKYVGILSANLANPHSKEFVR